jgi:hypothetical protein
MQSSMVCTRTSKGQLIARTCIGLIARLVDEIISCELMDGIVHIDHRIAYVLWIARGIIQS